MKKLYVKPEMEVQEFAPDDTIMSGIFGSGTSCGVFSSSAGCEGTDSEYWTFTGPGCLTVSEDGICSLVVS